MKENNSSKTILVIAAILVVVGVGAALYAVTMRDGDSNTKQTNTTTNNNDSETTQPSPQSDSTTTEPVIVFTNDGFSQETYTFPADTDIRVSNESDMDVQFSSDDHPSHREHTELNMKTLGPGESDTFRPEGKGTYTFHDHINDQYTGTLIIE